jgi:hypothetical protein
MGLDMYLNASKYLSDYNEADKETKEAMVKLFPELKDYMKNGGFHFKEVTAEVGYWRKANVEKSWVNYTNCANKSWLIIVLLQNSCRQLMDSFSVALNLMKDILMIFEARLRSLTVFLLSQKVGGLSINQVGKQ